MMAGLVGERSLAWRAPLEVQKYFVFENIFIILLNWALFEK